MFRNYLKIALRNIRRYPSHSVLNVTGMAIGMACTILIMLWVQDEWCYDRQFDNANSLYRIIRNGDPFEGGGSASVLTPGPLAQTLKEKFPEIKSASRYVPAELISFKKGDEYIEVSGALVDKDFPSMFRMELIEGDINSVFNAPRSMIISEEVAEKYFGKEGPIGKTLTMTELNTVFTITGTFKRANHSHLKYDLLIPITFMGPMDNWFWFCYNYIELKKGTDSKVLERKIGAFLKQSQGWKTEISFQNIKKIHLHSSGKYTQDLNGLGDIFYVNIMCLIAFFILLIACINFMNLATAQSGQRSKEIGIRKMAGAGKRALMIQFIGESMLTVFIAHIIAMIIIELSLPGFNKLTGKELDINYHSAGLYFGLALVVLFCGLLAGSYPALYLSSLKPLDTMKQIYNKRPGNMRFRRMLVTVQFSLAILLIICTLIVGKQFKHIQNKSLGFNKDNIAYFTSHTRPNGNLLEDLKKEIGKYPDILGVTRGNKPINMGNAVSGFTWIGKREGADVPIYQLNCDADYAKTFQIEMKEGRFFSSEFKTDSNAVVINEKAAELIAMKDPVGSYITTPEQSKLNIIGVAKNFHFRSMHYEIEPLIMTMGNEIEFFIRMKPDNVASTVNQIEKTIKSFNLPFPVKLRFLDDDYENLYRTELRLSKIFDYFSFLAIVISCLGLFGLCSYMTVRRTKELGIRKVNGAKPAEIFALLSGEYLIWVSFSILIACPVAWYVMDKWLQNYAYRTNIGVEVFILAGTFALLIALLTVSFQSYRAARKNPVDSLRYE